jgi:5-oxopent-3-ene-1,2,5-tricarboxylate decarboxylase/2-hydroxyhepta-2,4-diene-1,7-dioate isomerase
VTPVVEGVVPVPDFSAPPAITDEQRADAWGSTEAAGLAPAFELTDDLKARLGSVGTATLSAQLRKHGYNSVSIDGLTPSRPGARLVGRARTLRFIPFREDLFDKFGGGYNAQKRAFDSLGRDDVLVIEARGERGTGTVGDILALRAQVRGAAGIVTDGGVRDFETVAALDLPTWSAGPHPAVLGRRHVPWDTDVTIACGGASVQPGDVIVGDGDGVLVIPPFLVEQVVSGAIEQELEETFIAEQVAAGESVDGLYPLGASWKERYVSWRAAR